MVGFDNYAPAIEAANANAAAAGVADRVRFEVVDVTKPIPGAYDLITTFDVVHDMPFPRPALKEIKKALKPGGTYFVLEFNFFGDLQRNIEHPLGIGAFGYAASTNYCMTQALAVGGEGTGTCMGEEKTRELAEEAGFTHFRRLDFEANPFNLFYEIRA
jgi:2-polyprenyl-3-methyl-5-hydroxy-6-metoxy-1,4-benzoquinol methylase